MSLYVSAIFTISPSGYKNNFDGENIYEERNSSINKGKEMMRIKQHPVRQTEYVTASSG